MIKETTPLSIVETAEYIKKKDAEIDVKGFIKKFAKLNAKEAKELRKTLQDLDFIKMDDKHISKIIDILPTNKEELNKIFVDMGLDENETNKILDETKKFK